MKTPQRGINREPRLARKDNTMAKVHAQVTGGTIKEIEAATVGEAKQQLGAEKYTATVNGEPVDDSQELCDFEFVALAPSVKGA